VEQEKSQKRSSAAEKLNANNS